MSVHSVALLSLAALGVSVGAVDTPSPNEAIPKPECQPSANVSIRYASTSARLYLENEVERAGCVTISEIWEARGGKAPLYAVDPVSGEISNVSTGTWLLTESLYVEDGVTLQVWGTDSGGDCDELRLLSTNETYINLRGYGGSLDFENTKVVSWDTTLNTYDTNRTDGRSYVSCVSEVIVDPDETCNGTAKNDMGECRMDIVGSEMAYLGHKDSESYGLTWKVRGFCEDKSNLEIFDEVNVYGNIYDSEVHHNYFAIYTYGHQQGDWRRNVVHSNHAYGFDPHDDSDFLTIHDNLVYNNTWHGIIASKRCNNVSIQGNTVYGGGETSAGIFLHRSSDYATVKNNYCYDNGDAGMAFLESFHAVVEDNTFEGNKYGIRLSVASADNYFSGNTVSDSWRYGLYTYKGSDGPETVESGFPQRNTWIGNSISGGTQSIKFKESDFNTVVSNVFSDPGVVQFNLSTYNEFADNEGLETMELKVTDSCFTSTSDEEFRPRCDGDDDTDDYSDYGYDDAYYYSFEFDDDYYSYSYLFDI